MARSGPQLTLGPVLFNWPNDRWCDFYARMADEAPVERVYLGEVVCSKRMPFRDDAVPDVIERLARAGKEVVLATLAMPTTTREISLIRDLIESGMSIEANDIAAIHLLDGRPHTVGPYLNIYNEETLAQHVALGATRICLPPELSLDAVRALAADYDALEVLVFGRAPLALSARCAHARSYGLPKDACQLVCERDGDGLDVSTSDGRPFLALNGIQTLGHAVTAATHQVAALRAAGVAALRLSPHGCDMVRVAEIFRDLADGRIDPEEATEALRQLDLPGPLADGYLRGRAGARLLQEVD
ncbi:MAG: U32 family peptidase [Hyphomicrobiales bacterium]|nr:U32 family peptidase [Hyphomicrobiales bacterium]